MKRSHQDTNVVFAMARDAVSRLEASKQFEEAVRMREKACAMYAKSREDMVELQNRLERALNGCTAALTTSPTPDPTTFD